MNRRIPLYRLSESQRYLERSYTDKIIVEPWSFTAVGKTLARCKLYDYENHRWLNFQGRQTVGPNPMMREFKERGYLRGNRRDSESPHGDAAILTTVRSAAGETQRS